jgi:hypothetical protein
MTEEVESFESGSNHEFPPFDDEDLPPPDDDFEDVGDEGAPPTDEPDGMNIPCQVIVTI